MHQIVRNYYALALRVTGARSIAYFAAIAIVTILTIITLNGLSVLLSDILPTKVITEAFSFPYVLFTGTAIFLLNMWSAPQSRFVLKEVNFTLNYAKVLLSISIPFVVFIYTIIASSIK